MYDNDKMLMKVHLNGLACSLGIKGNYQQNRWWKKIHKIERKRKKRHDIDFYAMHDMEAFLIHQ